MRRLRLQLIAVLVLAVLLPLLPARYAARELFRRSLDPLLASGITEGADAGLAVTREVIEEHKARWLERIRAGAPLDTLSATQVERLGLRAPVPATPADGAMPGAGLLVAGPELVTTDSTAALVAQVWSARGERAWVTSALPDSLAERAARQARGARLLTALRREHATLVRGFEATFLAVYAALALVVLAIGLVLTSRLTRPLVDLTAGIDRVAAGDWSARVPERGSGEVTELMRRFNAMTERLQTQQGELVRLERLAAWRRMARFLAHEVKNPLTPIQLAAEQMRDAYRGDDPAYRRLIEESAAIVIEEVHGLRNLVTGFSEFARLPEVKADWVDAGGLAQELRALYGPEALAVRVDPAAGAATRDAGMLWCDRDAIKRVLVNLLDNALAAQRGAGRAEPVELAIALRARGAATLRVRDHGPGIPPDQRRRVFEPDYTTKPDGMGLGLAIVESTVQHHGGTVAIVESEGAGAVFEIVLPAAPDEEGTTG